ncbi:uncharacterized protein TRUGW13939_05989 [Talaromyces rugulosus]|uniref:Major facilitator superfamily (MFS) profile domain-containing protein n=1 Tax=Talaromyces rugulosus TaxID=121627 RepID=A0A7H8QZM4_TALRU|nr:uncharacterized protein TRUGW13939_05989 [Talaromyces rugulosus]QKX58861.1 hypothetical protein TRUGW13939_05989 [Talaromyces rugulosus]
MASSETSPLISHPVPAGEPDPPPFKSELNHWKRWKVAYLYAFFILVINFGSGLRFAPQVRLMELAVCRRYYFRYDPGRVDNHGNVSEALCKLNVVQAQLAMLRAWLSVFNAVAGILVALPFGILADTMGRRLVTALSLFSVTLSKAWIILVSRSDLGVLLVPTAGRRRQIMAALSDSSPADKRTAVFFYTSTMCLVSELIATPIGSLIMTRTTLNAAMISSSALEFSGLFVLLVTPETLRRNRESRGQSTEDVIPPSIQAQAALRRAGNNVGILISLRPAVNVFLFALILPNLSPVLASRLKIPTPQADLLVAKGSSVLLVIGLVIIGLGQSLAWIVIGHVVYTLGWGFDQSVRLWLTSRVEQTQIGIFV